MRPNSGKSGAALVIVLSVVTLLSVIIIAFLGVSSKDVDVSKKASQEVQLVDVAGTAISQIQWDLNQEVRAGSVEPQLPNAPADVKVLYPATPASMVPDRTSVGKNSPPNLIKASASGKGFFDPAAKFDGRDVYPQAAQYPVSPRASSIATDQEPASVSAARWNLPALLPRKNPGSATDLSPATSGKEASGGWQWNAPEWVYVQSNGLNPTAFSADMAANGSAPVVARYAYQMYDVGGLLDLNVAGYDPSNSALDSIAAMKGSSGFADLTQVGFTQGQLSKLVAQRNAATLSQAAQSSGTPNFKDPYANFLLIGKNNLGFMRVAGSSTAGAVSNMAFPSRQGMISFVRQLADSDKDKAALVEALQSLTHFSRSLEQPSYRPGFYDPKVDPAATGLTPLIPTGGFVRPTIIPPQDRVDDRLYPINTIRPALLSAGDWRKLNALPYEMALGNNRGGNDAWGAFNERPEENSGDGRLLQDVINPGFLEVRVTTPFKRQDGTMAVVGEPLVKKRFPLERLAWITYKGPSALLSSSDPLYNAGGTSEAIYQCFGLKWDKDKSDSNASGGYYWRYEHLNRTNSKIYRLEELLLTDKASGRPREPDFLELLNASIGVGSLAKSAVASRSGYGTGWDPATYQQVRDRNTTFHVAEIAANLIDQADADSFPTIIKLPNPDPNVKAKDKYSPALFTARGVEDLPYMYRFHWRGIEDSNDAPSAPLGGRTADYPSEISGALGSHAGDSFKCGTTALMGFPELWNPHQANASFDTALLPTEFRVVASSEAPQGGQAPNLGDILSPARMDLPSGNKFDWGLSTTPKMRGLPVADPYSADNLDKSNYLWTYLTKAGNYEFAIQPVGFFAYTNGWSYTPTWNHNRVISTASISLGTWQGSNPTSDIGITRTGFASWQDYRSLGIFNYKSPTLAIFNPAMQQNVENFYYQLSSAMWKIDSSVTSDANFPLILGQTIVGGSVQQTTPIPAAVFYQTALKKIYPARDYTVGLGNLKYANTHIDVPSPYTSGRHLFAMSDMDGRTRDIFQDQSKNGIDIRGTELLFNVTNADVFREPMALCREGQPAGSNLKAGPSNFYSGDYGGGVVDRDGNKWVGFSMGEVPSNFIIAQKISKQLGSGTSYAAESTVNGFPTGSTYTAVGFTPNKDPITLLNVPANHVPQNNVGQVPGFGASPNPNLVARFFRIPVNVAGVKSTKFTMKLQFKEPISSQWITYEERYIQIAEADYSRWSASPVVGKKDLQLSFDTTNGTPNWSDSPARPIGWNMPVVTSYDPRTSRFGNPMRYGQNWRSALSGSNPRDRLMLNPDNSQAGVGSSQEQTRLFISAPGNATDRPGTSLVDLPGASGAPTTVTASFGAPAGWSKWFLDTSDTLGPRYAANYSSVAKNAPPIDVNGFPGEKWWAAARSLSNREVLYREPSPNAYDYGWYPRLNNPSSSAPDGSIPKSYYGSRGTTSSQDPTLPSFFQSSNGSYYADSLRLGSFSENIAPDKTSPYRQAYADADDVVRRASGALASRGGYSSIEGLPMGQGNPSDAANRPILLNRPFHSVADMGYAFRGLPWKNVCFFLPETADAALLDVFCVAEPPPVSSPSTGSSASSSSSTSTASTTPAADPLVAGKVNLNTRQSAVLRALFSGALKDELNTSTRLTPTTESQAAAAKLLARTTGTQSWQGPLTNVSDLAGKLFGRDRGDVPATETSVYTSTVYRTSTMPDRSPDLGGGKQSLQWHFTGFSADLDTVFTKSKEKKTQRMRESCLRALVDAGQTRVWNVMIDLIVQTGRVSPGSGKLDAFLREGEKRAWVYLSIDRFSGAVLEQKVEWVTE